MDLRMTIFWIFPIGNKKKDLKLVLDPFFIMQVGSDMKPNPKIDKYISKIS